MQSEVQIACLPTKQSNTYPKDDDNSQVAYGVGWGTTSSGGSVSSVLKDVDLIIYQSRFCNNVAPGYTKDWGSQICAGWWAGNKDTCQGKHLT